MTSAPQQTRLSPEQDVLRAACAFLGARAAHLRLARGGTWRTVLSTQNEALPDDDLAKEAQQSGTPVERVSAGKCTLAIPVGVGAALVFDASTTRLSAMDAGLLAWLRAQGLLLVDMSHAAGRSATKEDVELAGGFAHEIRNALGAARMPLAALCPIEQPAGGTTVMEDVGQVCTQLQRLSKEDGVPQGLRQTLADLGERLRADLELASELGSSMLQGLERGLSITREIIAYAHAGHIKRGSEQVAAAPMVHKLLVEWSEQFEKQDIVVQSVIPPELQLPMKEEHAYAIVRNLLANARDALHTQSRGARRITIAAQSEVRGVVVRVVDTGIGMSAAVAGRVFQPFFTTKGSDGTGLGLGLSRRLARLYGGDLTFHSSELHGSTFELVLPHHKAIQGDVK